MKTDGNSVWKDERIYEEPEKNAFELPDIIPNNPIEKKNAFPSDNRNYGPSNAVSTNHRHAVATLKDTTNQSQARTR